MAEEEHKKVRLGCAYLAGTAMLTIGAILYYGITHPPISPEPKKQEWTDVQNMPIIRASQYYGRGIQILDLDSNGVPDAESIYHPIDAADKNIGDIIAIDTNTIHPLDPKSVNPTTGTNRWITTNGINITTAFNTNPSPMDSLQIRQDSLITRINREAEFNDLNRQYRRNMANRRNINNDRPYGK